ncbi:hypothetical protein [Rufibacter ruber]|uniref:hypothetical protein n=1 Tax=Rufibacter ruber TaxID=1783499 RepID=UPI00082BBCBD|nr:hypothetical protein [Rufibacter ruber]
MIDKNRIPHTQVELFEFYKGKGVDERYFHQFLEHYDVCFSELDGDSKNFTDEDFEEDGSVQESALRVHSWYVDDFIIEIQKGHGEDWAHIFADSAESGESRVFRTYEDLCEKNEDVANQEIIVRGRSLGFEGHFLEYYTLYFKYGDGWAKPEEKTRNYIKVYHEQLSMGKTEPYADKYAQLTALDEYHKIYREEYAFAYAKAISEGKSEEYADIYGEKYGSALFDIKGRYGISDDEELLDHAIEKVEEEMMDWEIKHTHDL